MFIFLLLQGAINFGLDLFMSYKGSVRVGGYTTVLFGTFSPGSRSSVFGGVTRRDVRANYFYNLVHAFISSMFVNGETILLFSYPTFYFVRGTSYRFLKRVVYTCYIFALQEGSLRTFF